MSRPPPPHLRIVARRLSPATLARDAPAGDAEEVRLPRRLLLPALLLLPAVGVADETLRLPASAGGRRVPTLQEEWHADGLTSQAMAVRTDAGTRVVAFEDFPGSPGRGVVLFDPQTGAVAWRLPPVAGTGWGAMEAGEAGVGLSGALLDGSGGALGLVDPRDGSLEWTALGGAEETLLLGDDGGVASVGACALTLRDARTGAVVEEVPGRVSTVEWDAEAAVRSVGRLCAARPRVLGTVEGKPVVLAPETRGAGWRLFSVDGLSHAWEVSLGPLDAPPEVDWDTSTFWTVADGALRVHRRNLASGKRAWEASWATDGCATGARGVRGPRGAPSLLLQLCGEAVLLDPHDGVVVWSAPVPDGVPAVVGEGPSLPEPYQAGAVPLTVRWFTPEGAAAGVTTVPPGSVGTPYGPGLLVRGPEGVSLRDRADGERWGLDLRTTGWVLHDDLLVLAVEGVPGRLVVSADDGRVLGRYPQEAVPTAIVPAPGSDTRRLLVVFGDGLRALRLPGR